MGTDSYTCRNTATHIPDVTGPVAGKKVVIQPNMSRQGWPTDAGSLALEGFTALEDATVIMRLLEAGAELIGSGRMSELGFGLAGDTTVGAITAGEAEIALITDTMGESRVAASMSGLFGFKPSYGTVSRFGLIGLVPSMECYGVVAKDPGNISTVMGIISGLDENDYSMADDKVPGFGIMTEQTDMPRKAGVLKECLAYLNAEEQKAFRAGLARLEGAGMQVVETSLEDYQLFRTVHNVVGAVEASSSAGKYDGVRYGHRSGTAKNWNDMYLNSRKEAFQGLIKVYLFQGAYFQFENYPAFEAACRIRRRLTEGIAALFGQVDILAFPTRRVACDAASAATISETYDAFLMTLPANLAGLPSFQIPSPSVDPGTDAGMQIVGPRLSDAGLLAAGIQLSSTGEGVKQI